MKYDEILKALDAIDEAPRSMERDNARWRLLDNYGSEIRRAIEAWKAVEENEYHVFPRGEMKDGVEFLGTPVSHWCAIRRFLSFIDGAGSDPISAVLAAAKEQA